MNLMGMKIVMAQGMMDMGMIMMMTTEMIMEKMTLMKNMEIKKIILLINIRLFKIKKYLACWKIKSIMT